MQYFALLISKEHELTPDERPPRWPPTKASMPRPGPAIRAGDALLPSATGAAHHGWSRRTDGHRRPVRRGRRSRRWLLRVRGREPRRRTRAGPRHPCCADAARSKFGRSSTPSTPSGRALPAPSGWRCCWSRRRRSTPRHTGVGGRSGAARRIRRCRGRSHRRRGGFAPAGDGDDGAGSRRPGAAHRRAVRGERRDRQGRLPALSRRPRRGRQVGVDDSGFGCRGPAVGWGLGALAHEWSTWTASFGGSGARPSPRWPGGRVTSPSPRTPSRRPSPRRCGHGRATVYRTTPADGC